MFCDLFNNKSIIAIIIISYHLLSTYYGSAIFLSQREPELRFSLLKYFFRYTT